MVARAATVPALLGTPHQGTGCSKPPQGPGKCAGNFGPILVKGINELMSKMQQPPAAGAFQGPGPGQGTEALGPASRRCWSGDAALEESPGDRGAAGAEGRPGTHQSARRDGLHCAGLSWWLAQSCCWSQLSFGRDSVEGHPRAWRYVGRGWTWRMRQQWRGGGGRARPAPGGPGTQARRSPCSGARGVAGGQGRSGRGSGGQPALSPVAMET